MLGIRALFNWFARPRGPRPVPIKIDPSWFRVPQPAAPPAEAEWTPPWAEPPDDLPPWQPPWVQIDAEPEAEPPQDETWPGDFDPVAFAEEYPDWDEEPPDPEPSDIHVRPGERVPDDAGELLRSFYLPGVGDVRVFARLHPDEMDLHPDQIIEPGDLRRDFNLHFRPKGPKRTK